MRSPLGTPPVTGKSFRVVPCVRTCVSQNQFQNMQFTYRVAPFSDHCHVSYAFAYNALLNTHAQTASPCWNYNNTTFRLRYAFDRALLLGQLVILKILLPRMPHLGAQTGCCAGRRRTCRMDHQTRVRASSKADGSSG